MGQDRQLRPGRLSRGTCVRLADKLMQRGGVGWGMGRVYEALSPFWRRGGARLGRREIAWVGRKSWRVFMTPSGSPRTSTRSWTFFSLALVSFVSLCAPVFTAGCFSPFLFYLFSRAVIILQYTCGYDGHLPLPAPSPRRSGGRNSPQRNRFEYGYRNCQRQV